MSKHADIKKLRRQASKQGWTITVTGSTHLKWTSPTGSVVFSSLTPSDRNAMRQHERLMRKYGFDSSK